MSFKTFLKALVVVPLLGAVVYVGVYNTRVIDFNCPRVLDKPVKVPVAWILAGAFAGGMLAGAVLVAGRSGSGAGKGSGAKSKG